MKRKLLLSLLAGTASLLPLHYVAAQADAITLNRVVVQGNQRIEPATIQTYLGMTSGSTVTRYDLDRSLKELYDTGFFADVNLGLSGNDLIVNVVENPSLSRVAFEGNKKIKDADLEKEITLRSRSIYTRTAVQNDVKRLLDVYRRNGQYSATVEPKIIQREQNRVDLVYEIEEGPVTSIRNITFIGNKAFSSSDLRQVVNSEEYTWYQFLSNNDKYDPDRLAYDEELLRKFYRSQGYADFQVKASFAELTPDRDAFYLTFTLDEGPRYDFGKVNTAGTLVDAQKIDLNEQIITESGDLFNAEFIEKSIDNMIDALGDRGFAFVDIEPQLARRRDANIIDLTYNIKEGPRVYVERINIDGNSRTLDEVIRREFRVAEGDAYSTTRLRRSEQRLNNLGYFESVKVTTEKGTAPDKTIINVEVVEKSTGEITLGAGFSSVDGPLADVGMRERNLLGRGQDLRARVMAAAKRQQFDIGFTEPYTFNRELSTGFDLYKITQDFRSESSFDRDAIGGKLRAGYALSERLQHSVYYGFEENSIENVAQFASRYVKDQEGTNVTSLVGHAFTYDARDNRFSPTSGLYLRLNQDIAGLGGDDRFLRHEAKSEYYIPVADQWTFALAGSAGHIHGLDEDVRINQRFFVGGRDLRGFDQAGIGPRDITTGDALGGEIYYTGSSELRFPLGLPDDLGISGAAFVDVGSLWSTSDSGPEVVDENQLRAAGGFGIAWSSPFGPIRVDYAIPFMSEDYDVDESFRFSFGTRF